MSEFPFDPAPVARKQPALRALHQPEAVIGLGAPLASAVGADWPRRRR